MSRICEVGNKINQKNTTISKKLNDDNEIFNKLKEIRNSLGKMIKVNSEPDTDKTKIFSKNEHFLSNPVELLKKDPILLGKSFTVKWMKSNVSASFILNKNETFLIWPEENTQKKLHIYNVTYLKKEKNFHLENISRISVVSIFQNHFGNDIKQWLYIADDNGIFKVYDLITKDKNNKFKEIYNIDESFSGQIYSAAVFSDKYQEIIDYDSNDKSFYALICFFGINKLYKLGINGEKTKMREIIYDNSYQHCCFTINFYHDDIYKKTIFCFGFTDSFIKLYDLKLNSWLKQQFQSVDSITSINFFSKKIMKYDDITKSTLDNSERFIIYTEKNKISIGNILTGTIIKEIIIPEVNYINDLCLWNSNYFLIATYNENSLKVLNLEDLKIVYTKKIGNSVPTNLIKIITQNQEGKISKECIVSCQSLLHKEISKIELYL